MRLLSKAKRNGFLVLAGFVLFALSGCASTPDRRIAERMEVFESFSPEVQENVRRGIVELGYNKDMVWMALGAPHRTIRRRTEVGTDEIWIYSGTYVLVETARPAFEDRFRRSYYRSVAYDVERRVPYNRIRVEFRDGTVQSIVEEER